MTPRPLSSVVARLARAGLLGAAPEFDASSVLLSDASTDSRAAGPGTLFCAVRGTTADGHDFLPDVAAAGAAAALVEAVDPSVDLPQVRVRSGRLAAAHAAAALFGDPWEELTLVGVTGTNGKTTTAAVLRHLLAARGPAASVGTLGAVGPDGETIPGTEGLTTPGPVETARWLRRLADEGVEGVAMEVSSHALDQGRTAAARFDAAVFTNLSRDHLDYHPTMEAYRGAKLRLAALLKEGGAAAVNADDPAWADVQVPEGRRLVRWSVAGRPDADVRAEEVDCGPEGSRFVLATPDGRAEVRLPLVGDFNVANALGAAAALWALGRTAEELAAGLGSLPQVRGRLERIAGPPEAPPTLVDYAHTPDALERALRALRPLTAGRLIVVFGAGGDRDRGKRPEMGRAAAEYADLAVLTSDNPRTEDPERILDDVEAGMGDAPRLRLADRTDAIRRALAEAGEGDVLLLAGKGHETYQVVGTEKRPYDERAVVRELIAEREPVSGRREG